MKSKVLATVDILEKPLEDLLRQRDNERVTKDTETKDNTSETYLSDFKLHSSTAVQYLG